MHFPKRMAYTELGSQRQVEKISTDWGETWATLTDKEKKDLKRGQFAFGSLYPYVFDGLANAATHFPKLFQPHNKYYYFLEMPIDNWCDLSLMEYQEHSREHFMHELLRRGSTTDKEEAEYLRCIPIRKGDYISTQPLVIGFSQKTQEEISSGELKRLMNLKTYSKCTKVIRTVFFLVFKPLINPLFNGHGGGWFSCPNALQAKIVHTLQTLTIHERIMEKFHPVSYCDLDALFIRKYFLHLNSIDGYQKANYITANAIDLWEHVSPAELIVNSGYKYIRNWCKSREKLEAANRFFEVMETRGLMEGAKAFPVAYPRKAYYQQR